MSCYPVVLYRVILYFSFMTYFPVFLLYVIYSCFFSFIACYSFVAFESVLYHVIPYFSFIPCYTAFWFNINYPVFVSWYILYFNFMSYYPLFSFLCHAIPFLGLWHAILYFILMSCYPSYYNRLVGVMISERKIVGSSPGRVKQKTIKLAFVASTLSTQH